MPGGTLVLRCAPKIAETNDSDPYLFKTSKILKNGSVFLKLQLGKVGNTLGIWGNPAEQQRPHAPLVTSKVRFVKMILEKVKVLFWLFRKKCWELDFRLRYAWCLSYLMYAKNTIFHNFDENTFSRPFFIGTPTYFGVILASGAFLKLKWFKICRGTNEKWPRKNIFSSKSQKRLFFARWKYDKYYAYPMQKSNSQQCSRNNQNKTLTFFKIGFTNTYLAGPCMRITATRLDSPIFRVRYQLCRPVTFKILNRF